jgi:uncharacterized RDD family membrane protein YckC
VTSNPGDYTTLVPVTGEAVALDLRLAQVPSRTLALTLDLLIQGAALVLLTLLSAAIGSQLDSAAAAAIALVSVVLVLIGMPTIIETLTRGRSVGKMAAGLRVVRDDGGPVRFRHAFVRALFMMVDFWLSFGVVGLFSALLSSRAKRVGDHFAGTVVIRERVNSAAAIGHLTYRMPPALEGWAATLDLTRLPDASALQARQFLSRAASIAPQVRETIGLQLAAEMSTYVAPAAPAGLHPETYLSAVLTERMRRAATVGAPSPLSVFGAGGPSPTAFGPPPQTAGPAPAPTSPRTAAPGQGLPQSGPFTAPR